MDWTQRACRGPVSPAELVLIALALAAHATGSLARWPRRMLDSLVDAVIRGVLARVDLAAVAEEVLAAIDLPEIIRRSTGSLAAEAVDRARLRGIDADDAVTRVRNRLLRRGPA